MAARLRRRLARLVQQPPLQHWLPLWLVYLELELRTDGKVTTPAPPPPPAVFLGRRMSSVMCIKLDFCVTFSAGIKTFNIVGTCSDRGAADFNLFVECVNGDYIN